MKLKTKNRAFTLIELLVVIAIIGILASVVIASLNSARTKGRYAAIKSNLRNAVSQASVYFNENGTYSGICADSKIVEIVSALGGSGNATCYTLIFSVGIDDWGLAVKYDDNYFTADPSGVLQLDTTDLGSTQNWNNATASCASAGKRIPGVSSLRAIYSITGSTPDGFVAADYWSSTPHPTNTTLVGGVLMNNGVAGNLSKSVLRNTRCGS